MRPESPTKYDVIVWILAAVFSLVFAGMLGVLAAKVILSHVPTYTEYNYCPELQEPHATQR